ncbi:glycoside hydrolase family 19 protein [Photobacterium lipolyticum]|nr:glycoside hydrolase family 19 protein [Photobacterium lipolyticum]
MEYKIKPGDTLTSIAIKFFHDPKKSNLIAEENGIIDPNKINIDQVITIPNEDDKAQITSEPKAAVKLTKSQLKRFLTHASEDTVNRFCEPLNDMMERFGITTKLRVAHFLAQVAHESAEFSAVSENLNYSANALRTVFGNYFLTEQQAQDCARKPEVIANIVYSNRMGNGDQESGDGWRYRGRGLIQLTGNNNYQSFKKCVDVDVVTDPDLVAKDPSLAVASACWFWQTNNINRYADRDDLNKVTRLINGGTNGLHQRGVLLERAKAILD